MLSSSVELNIIVDASGVIDPFARDVGPARQITLQPHQRAAVDLAAENLKIALVK